MCEEKPPTTIYDCKETPKYWDNDEKMDSWFAPFRSRDLNPLNYDNKMNYWKDNVNFFCNQTKAHTFTQQQVKTFFLRNGKTPTCLPTVFEALHSDGTILEDSEYDHFLSSNTWSGWAVNALYNGPMKWLSKKVVTAVKTPTSENDENIKYIHLSSFKKHAENLHKYVTKEERNSLVTYEKIKAMYLKYVNVPVEMSTIKMLVRWLINEKKACVIFEDKHLETHLLKFAIDSQPVEPIDESEITMYCLQSQEKSLCIQLEQYEQEMKELVIEVKNRLKQGQKNMARSILRKKKELEKRIEKISKSLDNIQTLLYTVEETESDKAIIKSYQAGAKTLKSKFTKGELNLNQVDVTMSEIDEVLSMHADLQHALGQSVAVDANEADLEDELSELLLNDVPSIPPGQPSSQKGDKSPLNTSDLPAVPKDLPQLPTRNVVTE